MPFLLFSLVPFLMIPTVATTRHTISPDRDNINFPPWPGQGHMSVIKEIERDPFDGIGKPEPLKNDLTGFWSRRITDEHRLVYSIEKNQVRIAQARYHY